MLGEVHEGLEVSRCPAAAVPEHFFAFNVTPKEKIKMVDEDNQFR